MRLLLEHGADVLDSDRYLVTGMYECVLVLYKCVLLLYKCVLLLYKCVL